MLHPQVKRGFYIADFKPLRNQELTHCAVRNPRIQVKVSLVIYPNKCGHPGLRTEASDRGVHFCLLLRHANGLILKPAAFRKLYPVKFLGMDTGLRRYDGIAGLSLDDFMFESSK
jgi:hypothetical protein